jgi:lipopolysaccharide/colanic/teichoic acid biosynthesis glycosyltransferase
VTLSRLMDRMGMRIERNKKGGVVALHDHGLITGQSRVGLSPDAASSSAAGLSAKRLLDVVVATTGLVLLSPLIFLAAIASKIDSGGPVFCRETVYGYTNRPIRILKFRSATDCWVRTNRQNRFMPLGEALRRSGIDELPQLVNVLRGELSIVGPRPFATPADFLGSRFTPLSNIKSGMIDCGQIAAHEDFRTSEQRFSDAMDYVESWSLLRDIKIILITVFSSKSYARRDEAQIK